MILAGVTAFLLFFLSDYNDLYLHAKPLRLCFPLGFLLLAVAIASDCITGTPLSIHLGWQILALVVALFSLLTLVLSLFVDIPVGPSYQEMGQKRPLSTKGLYAVCRHPGVLSFAFLAFSLSLATGLSFFAAGIYSVLNILLALYEDKVVFPALIYDYAGYKKTTPFLIPGWVHLQRGINDYKQRIHSR